MKITFIFILILLFFAGGFYSGYKFQENKIELLKKEIDGLQKQIVITKKEANAKKEMFKKQLKEIAKEWESKKKEIDLIKEKIDTTIKKFSEILTTDTPIEKLESEKLTPETYGETRLPL